MASVKQIALNLKRANDKIARLTKELYILKEARMKLSADLRRAKEKESFPKKRRVIVREKKIRVSFKLKK